MKTSKTVILTLCLLLVFTVFPAQAFADEGEVYKTLDLGTMYQYYDCFVYVPAETDENTACCVHFAGGSGGWLLRQDYAVRYIQQYAPNSIFIWYKNSGIYEMAARVERTVSLLSSLEEQTGLDFGTVTITASSNGGYTSLYAASHLKSDYEIATDRVIILDMGNVWGKSEFLISKEEAEVLIDMNTTVYHFGRKGETFKMPGAKTFGSYGVPLVEVACKGEGHDQITSDAFTFGVFSWAIDDGSELNADWYSPTPVNF